MDGCEPARPEGMPTRIVSMSALKRCSTRSDSARFRDEDMVCKYVDVIILGIIAAAEAAHQYLQISDAKAATVSEDIQRAEQRLCCSRRHES